MAISERNTETMLEALAERIRELKTDIFLKDAENARLKDRVADLEKKLKEAQNGNAN